MEYTTERALKSLKERFEKRVVKKDGCWDWTGAVHRMYGKIHYKQQYIGAYRASWLVHYGEITNGLHVLHNCHNHICTNPSHLRLGTHQENMKDRENNRKRKFNNGYTQTCIPF